MEEENKLKSKIVKTYAEDMATVIENDKEGLIKKIIHGEEEHEREKINLSPESKKNKFFMLVSLLLVCISLTTLLFFFFKEDADTIPIEQQSMPLVFSDATNFLEVAGQSKDTIAQTVRNAVTATKVKAGGVEGIYLTVNKKVLGLRQFIALIKASFVPAPSVGDLTLVSDNFLMGAVNERTKDFFILIKVRELADIFDALRAWEGKLFFDMHGFFGVEISAETKYLLTKSFEDGIIENKNARILYDTNNNIVLMYVFADDTSVVITNTEGATHEIMLRLASSRVKK